MPPSQPGPPACRSVGSPLVREGKVRGIGCSNFSPAQLHEADRAASAVPGGVRFTCVLNQLSLLERTDLDQGLAPRLPDCGWPTCPSSHWPAACSQARSAATSPRRHTLLELAFGWLLAQPPVSSVIAGATTPDQARANAAAAGWQLSTDDLTALPQ